MKIEHILNYRPIKNDVVVELSTNDKFIEYVLITK